MCVFAVYLITFVKSCWFLWVIHLYRVFFHILTLHSFCRVTFASCHFCSVHSFSQMCFDININIILIESPIKLIYQTRWLEFFEDSYFYCKKWRKKSIPRIQMAKWVWVEKEWKILVKYWTHFYTSLTRIANIYLYCLVRSIRGLPIEFKPVGKA